MRRVLSGVLLAALAGCATLSESECRNRDWGEIGRDDALHGRPVSRLDEHRQACARHGVKPDAGRYRSAHAQGLKLYCTPAGGYVSGRRGDHYADICPASAEPAFRPAFRDGRAVHSILRELEELQRRMDDVELLALSSGDLSPDARTQRHFERSELRREYDRRQAQAERLDERYALKYKVDPLRDLDFRDPRR